MEMILTILGILIVGAAPLVGTLFVRKRRNTAKYQIINPLASRPRYRDGATTYNVGSWGTRFNVEVEDPRESHNSRYQRRHTSRRHKQMKPWEKS